MSEHYSKSRQQAEIAFGKTQSQFFARGQAFEELDSITAARNEKTARLREARLAKEAEDSLALATKSAQKRAGRS
jgi:hypothetical protein